MLRTQSIPGILKSLYGYLLKNLLSQESDDKKRLSAAFFYFLNNGVLCSSVFAQLLANGSLPEDPIPF